MSDQFTQDATAIAALADPMRRDLYSYVVAQQDPVSRDEAAAALDLPRHTVKFHLDKLVDEGLLVAHFRRLSGMSGPGAGRPSKLYSRSDREVALSVPARDYQIAAEIMAKAIEQAASTGTPILEATRVAARSVGSAVADSDGTEDQPAAALCAALSARGYRPRTDGHQITLDNCPFHQLAQHHKELICTMNLELVDALADELGEGQLSPRLDPDDRRCCVVIDL